jgi:hypothetical protein
MNEENFMKNTRNLLAHGILMGDKWHNTILVKSIFQDTNIVAWNILRSKNVINDDFTDSANTYFTRRYSHVAT